jgi:hypothetical protein
MCADANLCMCCAYGVMSPDHLTVLKSRPSPIQKREYASLDLSRRRWFWAKCIVAGATCGHLRGTPRPTRRPRVCSSADAGQQEADCDPVHDETDEPDAGVGAEKRDDAEYDRDEQLDEGHR